MRHAGLQGRAGDYPMNRLQRRGKDPRIDEQKRHMSDRVLEGMMRVGPVAGKSSGPEDSIMRNPDYDDAKIEFACMDHLGRKIEHTSLPLRYATQEDFPDKPVPPFIYKSCLK